MPLYIALVDYTDRGMAAVRESPRRLDAAEALLEAADEARARAGKRRFGEEDVDDVQTPPRAVVDAALSALRDLLEVLRAGRRLSRYDLGSLELHATELLGLVGSAAQEAVA